MAYNLVFTKQAFKELEKIRDPFYSQLKQAIINLTKDPRPEGCKKLKGREGYRIRSGQYRVIYQIFDTQLVIEVVTIGNRKNVYR